MRRAEEATRCVPLLFVAVLVNTCIACNSPAPTADNAGWVGTITTDGNITTVVNEGGSVWGGPAVLVEEASIGVEAGPDEYMLGNIVGIAVNDESIYLVDPSVPIVRVYDHAGLHMMNIGGAGQGPGEFSNPRSAAVSDDGTLYVYADRRVSVYSPTGEPLDTWPFFTGFESGDPPVLTVDDALYFHDLIKDPDDPASDPRDWQHGMIASGPDGPVGVHIPVPELALEPYVLVHHFPTGGTMTMSIPFAPSIEWVMSRSGAMIAGVSSDYRFEVHQPDGNVLVVQKAWDPLPVTSAEAEWNRKRLVTRMQSQDPEWRWDGPEIPGQKAAYSDLYAGSDGRIWALRVVATETVDPCDPDPLNPERERARSCWRQVYAFDIFDADGRFLGTAERPEFTVWSRPVMRGDNLIAYVEDEAGLGMVKRFRLSYPDGDGP